MPAYPLPAQSSVGSALALFQAQAGHLRKIANALASSVSTMAAARSTLTNVKAALSQLASYHAMINALRSRLSAISQELVLSGSNLSAAGLRS